MAFHIILINLIVIVFLALVAPVRANSKDVTEYAFFVFQELCISKELNHENILEISLEDGWRKIEKDSPLWEMRQSDSDRLWLLDSSPMSIFAINDVGGCKIILHRIYKQFLDEFIDMAPANKIHSEMHGPLRFDLFAFRFRGVTGALMVERYMTGDSTVSISFMSTFEIRDLGEDVFADYIEEKAP